MISRLRPGGAQPYDPLTISRSVPHTPSASARTRTVPSESGGSGTSSMPAELAMPGATVRARMLSTPQKPSAAPQLAPAPTAMKRMFLNKVPDRGTGMPAVPLHQTTAPHRSPTAIALTIRNGDQRRRLETAIDGDAWTDALGDRGRLYSLAKFVHRSSADLARDGRRARACTHHGVLRRSRSGR